MLKNIKKILVVAGLISAFFVNLVYANEVVHVQTVAQAQAREGAWEQDALNQWKYSLNGVYLTNTWIESITEQGAWYFLNENGIMATNTNTVDGYYVNATGVYRASQVTTVNAAEKAEKAETIQETQTETTNYASGLFEMGGGNSYTDNNIDTNNIQINSY